MQLILQLLALFDKILDPIQLRVDSTARFEPAGVMKDKAVSRWVLKLVFDLVFSARIYDASVKNKYLISDPSADSQ